MARQIAKYPKTYATVIGLFPIPGAGTRPPWPEWVIAEEESGAKHTLRMSWKHGGRSSTLVRVGKRIKVFQRPGLDHPNFRMVGD